MKIAFLLIGSLLLITACDKKSEPAVEAPAKKTDAPPAPTPVAKPANELNPVGKITNYVFICDTTEVVKHISEFDGSTTQETFKSHDVTTGTSVIVKKDGDKITRWHKSEYYSKNTSTKGLKTDTTIVEFTSNDNKESELKKIGENTFTLSAKREGVSIGKNGYQFNGPNKTKVDIKKITNDTFNTFFDDGSTSYLISMKSNGKDIDVSNETEKYTVNGNTTTSVITYKVLPIDKNKDGVVVRETLSFEQVCTDTKN